MNPLRRFADFFLAHRDHLVLLCLGAMVTVPFLHPHHYNPIPSFLAEWWAALFGIVAASIAFLRPSAWEAFPLPRILLLPLVLILTLLFQFGMGRLVFVEQALLMAAILLWACLMASLGQYLVRQRGLEWLADGLSVALLAGALLEVLSMALQMYHTGYATGLIFPRGRSLYGNLGQANHLNDYIWLAIASAFYLYHRDRLSILWLLATLTILLVSSALSGSRSIVLYATALTVLAWLSPHGDESSTNKLRRQTLFLLPAVILFLLFCREVSPWLLSSELNSAGTLDRFYSDASGNSIRLKLWQTALHSISEAPWLGHALGSVPFQYFSQAQFFNPATAAPVAEHVHNFPLQWMVEFGVPLTLLVLSLGFWWLRDYLRSPLTLARWWLLALLAIMGIHSLLEYPLWYTFFLGPFALLLGAGDTGRRVLSNGRRGLASFVLILVLAGSILGILRQDYLDIERILNWRVMTPINFDWRNSVKKLLALQANSLLAPQATVSFALMMEPESDHLEDRQALCRNAMTFAPTEKVVFKCVMLDAMAHDPETLSHMRRALAAFPEAQDQIRSELQGQLQAHPEYAPLLTMLPVIPNRKNPTMHQ